MKYDRLGFPVPREFEPVPGRDEPIRSASALQRTLCVDATDGSPRRAGLGKAVVVWGLLLFGVGPALLLPAAMPLVRRAVVQWCVESAIVHEGRDDVAAAADDVARAIAWLGADAEGKGRLLCWRATLLLENRQPVAAVSE
ncbi:MAG: hypothetical protein ACKOC4_01735, partial [Planctomycetia bacterium]